MKRVSGVKLPEREANQLSPFSTEVKYEWSFNCTPPPENTLIA